MKKFRTAVSVVVVGIGAFLAVPTLASAAPVITPAQQDIALSGSPFAVVPSPDGKYVFSSESGTAFGIGILEQEGSATSLVGTIETGDPAYGLAITDDGKYLLAAVRKTSSSEPRAAGVEVIDIEKAIAEEPEAILGDIPVTAGSGPIEVELSNDDRYAFVADEDNETVGVINLEEAITSGVSAADLIGYIPVDSTPVGLAPSPDGDYLYVSNEVAKSTDPGYDANACEIPTGEETGVRALGPEGSLTIVNLAEAETNPGGSVISTVLAGCQPVRVNLSNNGSVAWVTDRSSNEVGAYSTQRLLTDPADALISETPVGESPVGIQFFDDEQLIAVANSNRFNAGQQGTVSILNARRALRGTGESATLATFEAGEFPRQFGLSPDDQFLYLTEFSSDTLVSFPVADLTATVHPVDEFDLTLSTLGDGSGSFACEVAGGPEEPCAAEYDKGTEVKVVPEATAGSEFVEWGGDCVGTSACALAIDADKSVDAVFAATPSQGGGTAEPGGNSGSDGSDGGSGATGSTPTGTTSTGTTPNRSAATVKLSRPQVHGSSADLAVTVSGRGTIVASGRGVVAVKARPRRAGALELKLRLTGPARKDLARSGKLKVKVKFVFTPTDGSPRTTTTTVTFRAKDRR